MNSYRRYWLFGEKVQHEKSKSNDKNGLSANDKSEPKSTRIRGWFPRSCAVELMNPESDDEQECTTAKKSQQIKTMRFKKKRKLKKNKKWE